MNCPICNETVGDARLTPFCPRCHWEFLEISANASPQLKAFYDSQLALHKRIFSIIEKQYELEQDISALKHKKEELDLKKFQTTMSLEDIKKCLNTEKQKCGDISEIDKQLAVISDGINIIDEEIKTVILKLEDTQNYYKDLDELELAIKKARNLGYQGFVKDAEEFLKKHKNN